MAGCSSHRAIPDYWLGRHPQLDPAGIERHYDEGHRRPGRRAPHPRTRPAAVRVDASAADPPRTCAPAERAAAHGDPAAADACRRRTDGHLGRGHRAPVLLVRRRQFPGLPRWRQGIRGFRLPRARARQGRHGARPLRGHPDPARPPGRRRRLPRALHRPGDGHRRERADAARRARRRHHQHAAPAVRQRGGTRWPGADARARTPLQRQRRPDGRLAAGSRHRSRASRRRRRKASSESRATSPPSTAWADSRDSRPCRCPPSSSASWRSCTSSTAWEPTAATARSPATAAACTSTTTSATNPSTTRSGRLPRARERDRRQHLGHRQALHGAPGRRCPAGRTAQHGVVDHRGEVYGNPGLYVADGAALPAPLAAPPSVTIAAWAHHVAEGIAHAG